MLGQQFYHESIRKVIIAFGTMFNNVQLVRKDNDGNITQTMKVPLAYGPRQKWLVRLNEDADLSKAVVSYSELVNPNSLVSRSSIINTGFSVKSPAL